MADYTPMMQQYIDIKNKNKDCIIFYRLGDFYEMFFDDAKLASQELELTLTGRDCGQKERAPMCGVPYHSCEAYISRLVQKGYKVAICEQLEDPAKAKGLVKRDIVRIVTPGAVVEGNMLEDGKNNYCAAVYIEGERAALAFADISTGELYVTRVEGADESRILNEIGRYSPAEVVCLFDQKKHRHIVAFLKERLHCALTDFEASDCERDFEGLLFRQFGEEYCKKSGLAQMDGATTAAGALLSYFKKTQCGELPNFKELSLYLQDQFMEIDVNTRRNLELCETLREKNLRGSLLSVLKRTSTAMGSRTLRKWLEQPLCNVAAIKRRQEAVSELLEHPMVRDEINDYLKEVFDLERLMSKVVYGTAGGRDLRSLCQTFLLIPAVKELLAKSGSAYLRALHGALDELADLTELIERGIAVEPPFSVRDGGVIRDGYSAEVDELRSLESDGKGYLAALEARERERTGIKTLKVAFNKVFGYYLEVTKSYYDKVPEDYIRKQTLTNSERYITQELKDYEHKVLTAGERLRALEYELFCEIRQKVADALPRIQQTGRALAELDVLCCFASVAASRGYICPEVSFEERLEIRGGRHPVVEESLGGTLFVPNDTLLDCGENRMMVITGPNMAGKSTYMRQVATITLMAQMGCFVPAEYARIGIVDKLFTRVGASDDLAAGQSTFMVEMSEVSYILKHATRRSLLIFDEIGRGTSTFDGMSIARAVIEHVAETIEAKTLFATHYHELTALEQMLPGVKNYNVAVKKRGDDITFLRKIVRGGADDSYGIEVAKLAGMPEPVVERAKEVLRALESEEPKRPPRELPPEPESEPASEAESEIVAELRALTVDTLTPLECMQKLYELTSRAKEV